MSSGQAAMVDLHRRLLEAHDKGGSSLLVPLYREAAAIAEDEGSIDRACYFYTQAYVYALEAGEEKAAAELLRALVLHGRDT